MAREGVVLAAETADNLGKLANGNLIGRLEHQMFEKVGDPRRAALLVGSTDAIPDHVRNDRRPMIGDDHHLQAVRQGELGGAWAGLGERGGRGEASASSISPWLTFSQ